MSLSVEERKAVVEFRIEKALRAYEQAKGVVGLKYWETIANPLLCSLQCCVGTAYRQW